MNPYTRKPVLGFLPLSTDPAIVMRHISKMFGGNREMWHFARGFISMIAYAAEYEWMRDYVPLLRTCTIKYCEKYHTTFDLKGSSGTDKVPFVVALKNVLTNYPTCLRDRSRADVYAIMKVARFIMPDFDFPEDKIVGMINVVGDFQILLDEHKKGVDMTKYVMHFDELGHCAGYLEGCKAVIARLLWHDDFGMYKQLKLQNAVDASFKDPQFGRMIADLFSGRPIDYSSFAFPEPEGLHFGIPDYGTTMLPDLICVFCGATFDTLGDKRYHLSVFMKGHYYDGQKASHDAVTALGKSAPVPDIFAFAKNLLFKKYHKYAPFLHTQRCKNVLLRFIQKFTAPGSI
jgi:hypothetical protein